MAGLLGFVGTGNGGMVVIVEVEKVASFFSSLTMVDRSVSTLSDLKDAASGDESNNIVQ